LTNIESLLYTFVSWYRRRDMSKNSVNPKFKNFIAPSHPHAEVTKLLCPHHEGAGAQIY
jgi:hypothetical protein